MVHGHPEGDTTFPAFDPAGWGIASRREHPADARHAYAMTFLELRRDTALPRPPAAFPRGLPEPG